MALRLLVSVAFMLIPLISGAENDGSDSGTTLKKLPVKYGGPIVFSKAPPPVIYFPDPPKVSQDVLESQPDSAPKQVEYVPLPFEDLPILIYKSTDSPPIHVVSPTESPKDQEYSSDLRGESSETNSRYEARRLTTSYPRSYRETSDAYQDFAADLFAAISGQLGYKSNPIYVEAPDPPKPVFISSSSRPSSSYHQFQPRGTYNQLGGSYSYQGGGRSSYQPAASAPHIVYTGHPPIHLYTSPIFVKNNENHHHHHEDFGEFADASEQKSVAVSSPHQPKGSSKGSSADNRRKVGETLLSALTTLGMAANPFIGPGSGIGRTISGLRRPSLFGAPSWASALGLTSSSGSRSPFRLTSSNLTPSASSVNYAIAALNSPGGSYYANPNSGSSSSYGSRPSTGLSNPFSALFGSSNNRFRFSNFLKPSSTSINPFNSALSSYGFGGYSPASSSITPVSTGYGVGSLSGYPFSFVQGAVGSSIRPSFNFNPSGDLNFSESNKHSTYSKAPRGSAQSFYNHKYASNDRTSNSHSRARYRVPPTAATAAPRHHKPPIIIYQGVRPPVHVYKKQDTNKGTNSYSYPKPTPPTYHPPQALQEKTPPSPHYEDLAESYSDPDPNYSPPGVNDHDKHYYNDKPAYSEPAPYGDKSVYPEKGSSYQDKLVYPEKYPETTNEDQQFGGHYQPNNYESYNSGSLDYNNESENGDYDASYAGDQSHNYQQQNNYPQSSDHVDESWIPLQSSNSNYAEAHSISSLQASIQGSFQAGQDSPQYSDADPETAYNAESTVQQNSYSSEQNQNFSPRADSETSETTGKETS